MAIASEPLPLVEHLNEERKQDMTNGISNAKANGNEETDPDTSEDKTKAENV